MPVSFEANGRSYRVPERPTLAVCLDGTAPEYIEHALASGSMPRTAAALRAGGARTQAVAQVPTLTNVNNASIVTGVNAARHGIVGNHYLAPDGSEAQLTQPEALRAETIHAAAQRAGVPVLCVTAKAKLLGLLGAGGVPAVSAERAHEERPGWLAGLSAAESLGTPNPGIYDAALSPYAIDLALHLGERLGALLVYCSLTDYVQHKAAPGEPLADELYTAVDERIGSALDAGWAVGMVADHGMNAKTLPDGTPNVRYLSDALRAAGVTGARVILPITDPYVMHHGALGSLAWVHVQAEDRDMARAALAGLPGVEGVLDRSAAARLFELAPDRIGDLVVLGDAGTALGRSEAEHDLSGVGSGLRSHGGLHEIEVPLILCQPAPDGELPARDLRGADLHHVLLGDGQAATGGARRRRGRARRERPGRIQAAKADPISRRVP